MPTDAGNPWRLWRISLAVAALAPMAAHWLGAADLLLPGGGELRTFLWAVLFVANAAALVSVLTSSLARHEPSSAAVFLLLIAGAVNLWFGVVGVRAALLAHGFGTLAVGVMSLLPLEPVPAPRPRRRAGARRGARTGRPSAARRRKRL